MILSFRDDDAELLWETGKSRRVPADLRRTAWKLLAILNAAVELGNLQVPPGNRLEKLGRDRQGSTASESVTSFASVLDGWKVTLTT